MMESTIELNGRKYPYKQGTTISVLMKENNFDYSYIIVKINGVIIEEDKWAATAVNAGDKVEIIHVFGGG